MPRHAPAAQRRPARRPEDVRRQRHDRDPPPVPAHVRRSDPTWCARVAAGDTAHAAASSRPSSRPCRSRFTRTDEGEDARLWNALDERAPSCATHVARMKEQHAALLRPPDQPSTARCRCGAVGVGGRCRTGARRARRRQRRHRAAPARRGGEHRARHGVHDHRGGGGVVLRARPPGGAEGQTWQQLGEILASQPDGGDAWLRTHMPAPGGSRGA